MESHIIITFFQFLVILSYIACFYYKKKINDALKPTYEKLSLLVLQEGIQSGETAMLMSRISSIERAWLQFDFKSLILLIPSWIVSFLHIGEFWTRKDVRSIHSISNTSQLFDHSNSTYMYMCNQYFNVDFEFPRISWQAVVLCMAVVSFIVAANFAVNDRLLFCELQDIDAVLSKLHFKYLQQVNGVRPQQLTVSAAPKTNGLQSLLRRCQRSVYVDRWLLLSVLLASLYLPCAAEYAKEDEFAYFVCWLISRWLIHAVLYSLRQVPNFVKKLRHTGILNCFIVVLFLLLPVCLKIYTLFSSIHPYNNFIGSNRFADAERLFRRYDGLHSSKLFSKFSRFNTEDVRFVCDFQAYVDDGAENVLVEFEWYHDYKPFNRSTTQTSSSRGFMVGPQTWNDTSHKRRLFYGKQDLLLLHLTDSDYGDYICYCNIAQWFTSHVRQSKVTPSRYAVSAFILERLAVTKEIHFLAVGEPVKLASFIMVEDNEEGSLLVERRVNGKVIEELEHHWKKCSFIHHFSNIVNKDPQHRQFYIHYPIVWDIYSACLGYEALGQHTTMIRRFFYNPDTKTEDFVEADYPSVIHLIPATFDPITGNFIDSMDNAFVRCMNKSNISSNSDWECSVKMSLYYWQYISNEIYNSFCLMIVVLFSPFLILSYVLLIRTAAMSLLFAGSLNPPEVLTIHDTPVIHDFYIGERQPDDLCSFDVFLAYSSEDRSTAERVRGILLDHRMTVFDSHRDVVLGAQPLSVWNHAITRSRSFVVIVSAAYNASPELGQLQFRCLYDRVVNEDVREDRMLLLTTQPGLVSRHLLSLPVIDLTREDSIRQLKVWITMNLRSPGGRSLGQLCRDVASDMRHLTVRYPPLVHSSGQHQQTPEHGQQPGHNVLGAGSRTTPFNENACCKVFLSCCEDSHTDRQLAMKIKPVLLSRHLEVFDSVEDAVPGQEDLQLLASAAVCQAYVIIMSASYRRDPLTCRLHLPQLLHDLESGRVSPDDVLIISNTMVDCSAGVNRPGDDADWTSPEWFQAFSKIHWTGNLTEDDHLRRVRRWAYQQSRRWNRQTRHDLALLRQQFLEARARDLCRPFHLSSFVVKFLV